MKYSMMSDDAIIRELAGGVEQLRLARKMKEADMEKVSGISRKTYYNFKHGSGISLKNFIALLRALGELDRLEQIFPDNQQVFHPSPHVKTHTQKRVRDKQKTDRPFRWGDEQ